MESLKIVLRFLLPTVCMPLLFWLFMSAIALIGLLSILGRRRLLLLLALLIPFRLNAQTALPMDATNWFVEEWNPTLNTFQDVPVLQGVGSISFNFPESGTGWWVTRLWFHQVDA